MITRMIGAALLAMMLAGGSMAQSSGPEKKQVSPQAPQGPAITIPLSTGTAINAVLIGTLDSSRCKPGDPVAFRVLRVSPAGRGKGRPAAAPSATFLSGTLPQN